MKVKCIYNFINDKGICSYQKIYSTIGNNSFPLLEKDKEYIVMGIIFTNAELSFLIDEAGSVFDCPNQLFEITDKNLPIDWSVNIFKNSEFYNDNICICGYKELIDNEKSLLDLFECDREALLIYFKRKIELENYYEDLKYLK